MDTITNILVVDFFSGLMQEENTLRRVAYTRHSLELSHIQTVMLFIIQLSMRFSELLLYQILDRFFRIQTLDGRVATHPSSWSMLMR